MNNVSIFYKFRTLCVLIIHGWSPFRNGLSKNYIKILNTYGFPLFRQTRIFLKKYGGLRVNRLKWLVKSNMNLCPEEALKVIDSDWGILRYPRMLEKKVDVIGIADDGRILLMMDEEGIIYGGFDGVLWMEGPCGIESISRILFRLPVACEMEEWPRDSDNEND